VGAQMAMHDTFHFKMLLTHFALVKRSVKFAETSFVSFFTGFLSVVVETETLRWENPPASKTYVFVGICRQNDFRAQRVQCIAFLFHFAQKFFLASVKQHRLGTKFLKTLAAFIAGIYTFPS